MIPALRVEGVSVPGEGLNVDRHRPDSMLIRHAPRTEGSKVSEPGKQRGYDRTQAVARGEEGEKRERDK